MLHYLDDLDSKLESMRAHFEREAGSDSAWSSYNPSLGRPLLNTAKFLEKKEEERSRPSPLAAAPGAAAESAPRLPGLDLPNSKAEPVPATAPTRSDKP
jgi:3'-5' exoribonuclease